jgi:DNA-binding transcriptional regulator YdaS (Cro superfamily)
MLTEQEVMDRLRAAVVEAGGQRAFAEKHGLTPGYVNDVLHGKRAFADRILSTIGVERQVVYHVTYKDKPS